MENKDKIMNFCKDATFFMVKYESKKNEEFGKILQQNEIDDINTDEFEIHRSTKYKNDDTLFVFDLKPNHNEVKIDNSLSLLIRNLEEAKAIEAVYPGIFTWIFDGLSIKALALIPSGNPKSHSTLSRYGGIDMYIRIIRQHLKNIGKMNKGITPDFNFLENKDEVEDTILSIGSVNTFNRMYCIPISLNMTYIDILNYSKTNSQFVFPLFNMDLKYWAREINPDFIREAKHVKLKDTLEVDMELKDYPPCIKNLAALPHKGNYYRFLLSRFLLSVHNPTDAKFVYYSLLGDEEREHVKNGNCSTQWTYVVNNRKRYDCPSCQEFQRFCDKKCTLSHPLENIQKKMEEIKDEREN